MARVPSGPSSVRIDVDYDLAQRFMEGAWDGADCETIAKSCSKAVANADRVWLERRCGIETTSLGTRLPYDLFILRAIGGLWWWNLWPISEAIECTYDQTFVLVRFWGRER